MINSFDKDKFVLNSSYWTFYMIEHKDGMKFKERSGICEVQPISYDPVTRLYSWRVLGGQYYNYKTKEATLVNNMNGVGSVACNFYDREEDAIVAHDEVISGIAKNVPIGLREDVYKMLILESNRPKHTQEEQDAITWWGMLPSNDKKHVRVLFGRVPFALPK